MAKRTETSGPRLAKTPICHQRQIRVNQVHYTYRLKDDPVGSGRPVPWIQLKGKWLEQAGFCIDSPITVRVMDGCLVLTTD